MFNVVRRELLGFLDAAAGLPKVLGQPTPGMTGIPFTGPRPTAPVAAPVVLVHGYLSTAAPWVPLVRRLHAEGFVNIYTLAYDSLSTGVPQLAAELAGQVAAVRTLGHVHLVGHSLGGLVARYAVQHLGLDRITRTVVTVATPHRGSPLAWFGPGPAAAQLRPGSALLRDLPPLAATHQVRWAVLHAGADLVVPPPRPGEGRCLPGYGHHSILSAPELADAVVTHLRSLEPAPAVPEPGLGAVGGRPGSPVVELGA
ncbi:MAG: esterase/lipase family protein [Pseudonocardiaceae bacterium]